LSLVISWFLKICFFNFNLCRYTQCWYCLYGVKLCDPPRKCREEGGAAGAELRELTSRAACAELWVHIQPYAETLDEAGGWPSCLQSVESQLESAWFQPSTLKRMPDLSGACVSRIASADCLSLFAISWFLKICSFKCSLFVPLRRGREREGRGRKRVCQGGAVQLESTLPVA
jgi:hypothetical protein